MTHPKVFESPFESYAYDAVLGEGGAGFVLRVSSQDGSLLALKYLKPGLLTSQARKRFRNEVHFCSVTQHPNIVPVMDSGLVSIRKTPCPFYIMPLFQATLRQSMASMASSGVLPIFAKILDGVETAHLRSVFHRDLKPENILVSNDGLAISDFGIAHFNEPLLATAIETRHSERLANFRYAAPEQRTPNAAVDFRCDIYSLGLILNEMFTGHVPSGAGFKTIAQVDADYSFLDPIVDLMIQQDPQRRPQTIQCIKDLLIGHEQMFVSKQRLSRLTGAVVPAQSVSDDPLLADPPSVIDVHYTNRTLVLKLSRHVNAKWARAFNNPQETHPYLMGREPVHWQVQGDVLIVNALEHETSKLLEHGKQYVSLATRAYRQIREEEARRAVGEERKRLKQEADEEAHRQRLLGQLHEGTR